MIPQELISTYFKNFNYWVTIRMLKNILNLNKEKYFDIIILLLAGFWGGIYAIYLLKNDINPTQMEWLFNSEDKAQSIIGWLYFKNDNWHWPITFTDSLAYPTGSSIAYTDSLPIFAVFFKIFSPFFADNFQYFGLVILLNIVLQFFWGAKLGALFSRGSLFCAMGAGLLFMLAPPLVWRLHGHLALTSHWLILASLWTYFQLVNIGNNKNIIKIVIFQAILLLFSAGIHPYLSVMVLLIVISSHIQTFCLQRITMTKLVILVFSFLILLIFGWYFFGYFMTDGSEGGSYGLYSLNLNALFNPMDEYSRFVKPMPVNDGQYEGFNYLGIGIILLIFANMGVLIVKRNQLDLILVKQAFLHNWVLFTLALLLTLLALSNKVYWNKSLILYYPLPDILIDVISRFRASARFFWVVHYLIILAVLVISFKIWNHRQIKVLLTLVILIQFFDSVPLHNYVIQSGPLHSQSNILKSPEWLHLSKDYKKLIILPSYQCNAIESYPALEKIAALQNLKTNSARLARYNSSDIKLHCQQLLNSLQSGKMEKDAAYALDLKKTFNYYTKINADHNSSHYCNYLDGYVLCRLRKDTLEKPTLKLPISTYKIKETIYFTREGNNALNYQFGDWSSSEPSGTWTNGAEAHLLLKLSEPITDDLILNIEASPFVNEKHTQQKIDLLVNHHLVSQWTFKQGEIVSNNYQVPISKQLIDNSPFLQITFRILNPLSPQELGLSDDPRLLGLFVTRIQLYQKSSQSVNL